MTLPAPVARLVRDSTAPDDVLRDVRDLLACVLTEIRALRADLRRRDSAPELVDAVQEEFGAARFTAAGLLALADEEPDGALACALGELIDLNAAPRARATALGRLLHRLTHFEVVASQRGCAVYRLRTLAE